MHMHILLARVNQPLGSVLSCCSATNKMYTICSVNNIEKSMSALYFSLVDSQKISLKNVRFR